jgi:hypothetical protein
MAGAAFEDFAAAAAGAAEAAEPAFAERRAASFAIAMLDDLPLFLWM